MTSPTPMCESPRIHARSSGRGETSYPVKRGAGRTRTGEPAKLTALTPVTFAGSATAGVSMARGWSRERSASYGLRLDARPARIRMGRPPYLPKTSLTIGLLPGPRSGGHQGLLLPANGPPRRSVVGKPGVPRPILRRPCGVQQGPGLANTRFAATEHLGTPRPRHGVCHSASPVFPSRSAGRGLGRDGKCSAHTSGGIIPRIRRSTSGTMIISSR